MRRVFLTALAVVFGFAFLPISAPAAADIVIRIDKSAQRMSVLVDGKVRHVWPVSTGLAGGPPSGDFRPERLERKWNSRKYGWAPMPHAIFFHKGYAIHGTVHVSRLGRRASHGCVRLHPSNAATLFALVQQRGTRHTRISVGHGFATAGRPAAHASAAASAKLDAAPRER